MADRGPNPASSAIKVARSRALIKEKIYMPNDTRHVPVTWPLGQLSEWLAVTLTQTEVWSQVLN